VNHITFQYLGDLGYFLDPSKTMITCHDVFTFLTRGNLKRPWILQKYLLQGLKKCRYIIAISNFTKNEITTKLNIPKEKIVVIKNGVNREMFHPLSDEKLGESPPLYPKYKKILHVGSEEHRKNFRTLLKAFYLVKKKRDDIKLIRIGTPQHMDLIKSLNLVNDVIYLSDISNKRLLEIYNLCDLLIFPSLYEGWGAPGVEAAACGLPVVCSNIPVFKEIYKDFPEYFQPFDYKTLAEKVLKLLSNKNLKEIMVKKGFKVVKNYNWKESSNKYLKLAKNILNNG
jgi:glycosyltransferase involved in cell wall biosynthesis